jgi:hypothetical protein
MRSHPISHYVRGVRRGKNASEVVHKGMLNIHVVCSPVALLSSDKVNLILPVSLRGFIVKKLRILVSMLEPMSFSSLGPPSLLNFYVVIKRKFQLVDIVNVISGWNLSLFIINLLLELLDLSRNIAIHFLTPQIHHIKSVMQLGIDVRVGISPGLSYDVEALRVLDPYVLKSSDVVSFAGVISVILSRAKHKQNRVMIRRVARKVIVSSSRKSRKPSRAGTVSVQSLFYVMIILLVVRPSEDLPMIA